MMRAVVAACPIFALDSCGGGDGGPSGSNLEQEFGDGPGFQRLEGVGERADLLLSPTTYGENSITTAGFTVQDREVLTTTCGRTTCVDSEGDTQTIADLFQDYIQWLTSAVNRATITAFR